MLHNKPSQNAVAHNKSNIYFAYESGIEAGLIRDIWSLFDLVSLRAAQALEAATLGAPQTSVSTSAQSFHVLSPGWRFQKSQLSPCWLRDLSACELRDCETEEYPGESYASVTLFIVQPHKSKVTEYHFSHTGGNSHRLKGRVQRQHVSASP